MCFSAKKFGQSGIISSFAFDKVRNVSAAGSFLNTGNGCFTALLMIKTRVYLIFSGGDFTLLGRKVKMFVILS